MREDFTAVEAAKYLGVTREAVDLAAREGRLAVVAGGGPRRFSLQDIEEFHQARQAEKIAKLAKSGETPVSVARRVRQRLSRAEPGMPRPFSVKLAAMPETWRTLFNRAELAAACVPDGESCRWCRAAEFAAVLGLRPVGYAPAFVELFGGGPCRVCGPGLMRPYLDALAVRVRAGDRRPPVPRPPLSEAERQAAREWASRRPVTASVKQPAQDDDGKAMVQRRLRETRERLKAAKRAGDQKYAIRLQQTLRSLTADATAIDERASTRGQS